MQVSKSATVSQSISWLVTNSKGPYVTRCTSYCFVLTFVFPTLRTSMPSVVMPTLSSETKKRRRRKKNLVNEQLSLQAKYIRVQVLIDPQTVHTLCVVNIILEWRTHLGAL